MIEYILALDIGGTNPRMAMMKIDGENNYSIMRKKSLDKEKSSIIDDINDFLKECAESGWTTSVCCASVAGPIDLGKNSCEHPTNAKFPVRGEEIAEKTYLKNVIVINDFKAVGEAVAAIELSKKNENLVQVPGFTGTDFPARPNHYALPDSHGGRAIIGPGTGLGVSYLSRNNDGSFLVASSEGGNAGFPADTDYMPLFRFIRKKLNIKQIGMEALVSGQGLRLIMEFFIKHPKEFNKIVAGDPHLKDEIKKMKASAKEKRKYDREILAALSFEQDKKSPVKIDAARIIAMTADKNPKARAAMKLFMRFLGSASQSVALHGYSTGGLFIAGGIPAKNKELLMEGDFMRSFADNWKPNIRKVLRGIPVYLVCDYDISFYGCARAGHRRFKQYM